jgi:hypothetical protein
MTTAALAAALRFAATEYLWLAGFLLSAYGAGTLALRPIPSAVAWPAGVRIVLAATTGFGLLILGCLSLAVGGWLRTGPVAVLFALPLAAGVGFAAASLRSGPRPWSPASRWLGAALVIVLLPYLVRPLQPPLGFDELMYHLPQARHWIAHGGLDVDTSIRFPLFPYNFDLLYAAALLLANDVVPHLIHAAAILLAMAAVALAGSRYFGKAVGVLGAAIFFLATRWGLEVAYVDGGVTLFVCGGFLALALRAEFADDRLALLAALLFGLAAGTKLQGLLFAAIGAFWIVWQTRRPGILAGALFAFLCGCGYWYVRSTWISGDPIHPFGAPLFGYWMWDAGDLAAQRMQLHTVGGLPTPAIWPATLAGLLLRGASRSFRALTLSGYAAIALWALTSRYERYLMPAYPLLAPMSAAVIVRAGIALRLDRLAARLRTAWPPRLRHWAAMLLLFGLAAISAPRAWHLLAHIPATTEARDAFLVDHLDGYRLFRTLDPASGMRLYQFGFEGELYYSPVPTVGDWFGPARYRTVSDLAEDPARLAQWLHALGANAIMINSVRSPFRDLRFGAGFAEHFELIGQSDSARLYRVRLHQQ